MGFNQEHYAVILGVTKSLLSLVDLNERKLPPHASVKDAYMMGQWVEFEKNWSIESIDSNEIEKAREELTSAFRKILNNRDALILKGRKMEEGQSFVALVKSMGFIDQEYEKEQDKDLKSTLGAAASIIQKKLKKWSLATDLIFQIQQRTNAFQIAEFEKELEKLNKDENQPSHGS
jgi:mevalonate kinase